MPTLDTDPIRNFKFEVVIPINRNGMDFKFGFMAVQGLSTQIDAIPYREGGHNTTPRKFPGQADFSPVTLSRGMHLGSSDSWQWFSELFYYISGGGRGTLAQARSRGSFRTWVDINVLDHPVTDGDFGHVAATFALYNAWPQAMAFSDLDAAGNGPVIEQMTLVHEGFDVRWS